MYSCLPVATHDAVRQDIARLIQWEGRELSKLVHREGIVPCPEYLLPAGRSPWGWVSRWFSVVVAVVAGAVTVRAKSSSFGQVS